MVKSVWFDDYNCGRLTSFWLDLLLIIMDILSDRVPVAVDGTLELSVLNITKTEKKQTSGRQTQDRAREAPATVLGQAVRRRKRRKSVLGRSNHC